jgi:hypothetical protein
MSAATTPLIDGWEPDGDPADTMLRRYLAAWVSQCDAFVRSVGGWTTRTDTWALSDAGHPTGLFNAATLLAPLSAEDPWSTIDAIEAEGARGAGSLHLWSAWPTPDLRSRGWDLVGHPPLLLRPPARHLPAPPPPVGPDVARVVDGAALAEWEAVVVEGYPFPELRPHQPGRMAGRTLLEDERVRIYLGHSGDRAVSASALMTHEGLGVFAFAVTRPEARGRGSWRAHAVERLAAAPDLWMSGVFSDDSRPLAEAVGFVPVVRLTLWSRPRP